MLPLFPLPPTALPAPLHCRYQLQIIRNCLPNQLRSACRNFDGGNRQQTMNKHLPQYPVMDEAVLLFLWWRRSDSTHWEAEQHNITGKKEHSESMFFFMRNRIPDQSDWLLFASARIAHIVSQKASIWNWVKRKGQCYVPICKQFAPIQLVARVAFWKAPYWLQNTLFTFVCLQKSTILFVHWPAWIPSN